MSVRIRSQPPKYEHPERGRSRLRRQGAAPCYFQRGLHGIHPSRHYARYGPGSGPGEYFRAPEGRRADPQFLEDGPVSEWGRVEERPEEAREGQGLEGGGVKGGATSVDCLPRQRLRCLGWFNIESSIE